MFEAAQSKSESFDGERKVQFIPAKQQTDIYDDTHIFRTCAYCRVSTDSENQETSFELQQEHYEKLAGKNKNWDLQHIYADRGISGTSLKNRTEFNAMLDACWRGKYDLIVTKSVSRFARNLVDCISLVRRLKAHNPPIGVYFETDNLFTLSSDSELKLAILSTFAQEESVKKSESMVWSLKERFKTEKLLMPKLYGYTREQDPYGRYIKSAKLEIVEEEAEVVRFIYDAFIAGYSLSSIAEILTDSGVPTKRGIGPWTISTLEYILSNERYCGSILTWKTFTADVFEHKKRKNRHDRDQYLYSDNHEAIVSVETFEAAQVLLENKRRHARGMPTFNVINEGIFRGFVPVNHRWVSDDPSAYYEASNSVQSSRPQRIKREAFSAFDLSGFQVVRGQFMSARQECPSILVLDNKIVFNRWCQKKFDDVSYIQLLIHPTERKIAIRPCGEKDLYRIRWKIDPDRAAGIKTLFCQHFCSALFSIMDWDPDYRYRVNGTWAERGNEQIIVFDVSNATPIMVIDKTSIPDAKRARLITVASEDSDFGSEFYDFSIQNAFYYLNPRTFWNAGAKSQVVPNTAGIKISSEEELQMCIDKLRARVGVTRGD